MKARFWLAVIALSFVAACATPDVTPFAEQTAALETAIAAEKKAVADKMDELILLIEKGKSVKPPSTTVDEGTWENNKKSYLMSMAVVTQVLSEAKAYSDAVASLAAAGETGSEAAESVFPAAREVLTDDSFARDARVKVFIEQALTSRTAPAHPGWIEIEDVINRAIEETLYGKRAPRWCLDSAAEDIREI